MPTIAGTRAFYAQDGIVIYHGDCLQLLPSFPAGSVDFVLTDPPYLVNYRGRWDGERRVIVGDDARTGSPPLSPRSGG